MATESLHVGSEQDAWKFVETALTGRYDSSVVELEFKSWPTFQIQITGERYDSSITTSLMRSLVDLQTLLNRVYAETVYGKSARSLTVEEREALEINFRVEEGSSRVYADLGEFFTELGKNAMEKMTGRQVVTLVLGVAFLWTGASALDKYMERNQKELEEKNRHEATTLLLQQQPKLLEIQNEQIAAFTNILKSVSDANHVQLDENSFSKNQIALITASERQSTELARIDGDFTISSLKIRQDDYRIDLIRVSDSKNIAAGLYKGHLSIDEMTSITNAFLSESSISLNVIARTRGDVVTSANIVGVDDKAKGQSIAEQQLTP